MKGPSTVPLLADLCQFLDTFAPSSLAADWDNVGLLLGDPKETVRAALTCLTITPEVVAEAVESGVQLIVTHHPVLFRGTKNLSTNHPEGRLLWPLARAGVAVYSPHTAFDDTRDGINDSLARALNLTEVEPLRKKDGPKQAKIVVFTPESDLAKVSDAMFAAGAGVIGQYHECSFRLPGTGTFFGSDATNPTVGQKGRREEAPELRLEVVCPEGIVEKVVRAMRQAHSYEEPAFDVYPLRPMATSMGSGRIGKLSQPRSLVELARDVKAKLKSSGVQIIGNPEGSIQRIAIACGAAGEYLSDAARAKADVFLTGEMRFHDYLTARSRGVSLLLPGHYATERPAVEELAGRLQQQFPEVRIWASQREADPVLMI